MTALGRKLGALLRPLLALLLLTGCAPALGEEGAIDLNDLEGLRRGYLAYWEDLADGRHSGLERFALTVQRVVDTRARLGGSDAQRLLLDDLVDLFVGAEFEKEKRLAMSTPSVLGRDAIDERDGDLSGFAEELQAGEGRFRHFALNAAASFRAPDTLVDLMARFRGNDLSVNSADSRADVATNRIGQSFSRLLREHDLTQLGDGSTVHDWLLERFGE